MPDGTLLWNYEDAAIYLGVAPSTIRVWCCKRKVPFIKMGGKVKFRQEDLDDFLNSNLIGVNAMLEESDAS